MNTEPHEGEEPSETGAGPSGSRERRAKSARAWQQMQYMGSPPDLSAYEDPSDEEH